MSIPGDPPSDPAYPPNVPPSSMPGPQADAVRFGASPVAMPSDDVLAGAGSRRSTGAGPRRRRRAAVIGGSAAAVVVVAAGAVWALSSFASSGTQPETMVPGNAIAYARVDLDPSAGQKLAAYRFLKDFPAVDQTASEGDLLDQVVGTLISGGDAVDFENDIKPWVGQRAAIAAVPQTDGDGVDPLVVIQVDDEEQARTTLRRLLDEEAASAGDLAVTGPDPAGLVVRDGYALISTDQATTDRLSAAAASTQLADDSEFSDDLDRLGEPGVATVWADLDATQSQLEQFGAADALPTGTTGGRLVAALRFGGGNAEIVARTYGATRSAPAGEPAGALLTTLPADTTAAMAVGDTATVVDSLSSTIEGIGSLAFGPDPSAELGLTLPEDLTALIGSGFVVALGDVANGGDLAVKVRTTDPAASSAVVDKLVGSFEPGPAGAGGSGQAPEVVHVDTADGVVHALTPEFAQAVAAGGTLGSDPAFTAAVPDAAIATTAAYVDLDRVRAQIPDPDLARNLEPVRSVGLVVRADGADSELRLTVVSK